MNASSRLLGRWRRKFADRSIPVKSEVCRRVLEITLAADCRPSRVKFTTDRNTSINELGRGDTIADINLVDKRKVKSSKVKIYIDPIKPTPEGNGVFSGAWWR